MALSALQYLQLKLNLRAFASANRYIVANLSEADLFSFWNQLVTDSASATALPTEQDAAIDSTLRAMLCANNSLVGLPDADWAGLFTQLTTDSSGAAALPTAQNAALRLQLRALISGYRVSPFNLSESHLLGYLKPRVNGFNGDFAALAATYGLTVRGFYRGDLGVTGTTGTGKSSWTNQSGDASAITVGTGATNGIGSVTAGLNNKAGIAANGADQNGTYTLSAVAPSTTNFHTWDIVRFLATPVSTGYLAIDSSGTSACILIPGSQVSPAIDMQQYNGSAGTLTTGVVINQWYRMRASHTGSASDVLRIGAHAPAAGAAGNNTPLSSRGLFASTAGTNRVSAEYLCRMHLDGTLANFLAFCADADLKAQAFWSNAIEI